MHLEPHDLPLFGDDEDGLSSAIDAEVDAELCGDTRFESRAQTFDTLSDLLLLRTVEATAIGAVGHLYLLDRQQLVDAPATFSTLVTARDHAKCDEPNATGDALWPGSIRTERSSTHHNLIVDPSYS